MSPFDISKEEGKKYPLGFKSKAINHVKTIELFLKLPLQNA